MERFALPIMLGFFEQLPNVSFRVLGSEKPATFTLIARRGVSRAGTRYWRRGADLQGNVANFVESEQLLTFADHNVVSSYVQVRGSLPILWSQAPNIKYKPPTLMAPANSSAPAFTKHADKLLEAYKVRGWRVVLWRAGCAGLERLVDNSSRVCSNCDTRMSKFCDGAFLSMHALNGAGCDISSSKCVNACAPPTTQPHST